jgi:hypothetical protein
MLRTPVLSQASRAAAVKAELFGEPGSELANTLDQGAKALGVRDEQDADYENGKRYFGHEARIAPSPFVFVRLTGRPL